MLLPKYKSIHKTERRGWIEGAREGKGVRESEGKDRETETDRQRHTDSKRQRDNIKIMQNLFYPLAYQSHAPRFIQEIYMRKIYWSENTMHQAQLSLQEVNRTHTHTHTLSLSLSLSLSLIKMALYT